LILFLYLSAFCNTGGIQRFNRSFIKALEIKAINYKERIEIYSAYDTEADARYYQGKFFNGFDKKRFQYVIASLRAGIKSKQIIISHINLSLILVLIKYLNPKSDTCMIVHGIEVWGKLSRVQLMALHKSDRILSVSQFTRQILIHKHRIPEEKIHLFPNTLDPYFQEENRLTSREEILKRHDLPASAQILLTVARLDTSEKMKGYDKILEILPALLRNNKNIYYILAGKYSEDEGKRLQDIISDQGLGKHVILTGYLKESWLSKYFAGSNVFVMPSQKEGFGIVYIEAMAQGTPAIAGNQDGGAEAVADSELGHSVNPNDLKDLESKIEYVLGLSFPNRMELAKKVQNTYGFAAFTERISRL